MSEVARRDGAGEASAEALATARAEGAAEERAANARLARAMYPTAGGVTHMTLAAETIAAAIEARSRPLTKAGPR